MLTKLAQVMEVTAPASVEYHVCINGCQLFPQLDPSEYGDHADECCSKCSELHFERQGGALVPRRRFWYLGVVAALRRLFANPRFCELRGGGRDEAGGFYKSPMAAELDRATGGSLFDINNSAYELGVDAGQMFSFRLHSTTVMGIRCGGPANGSCHAHRHAGGGSACPSCLAPAWAWQLCSRSVGGHEHAGAPCARHS